MIKPELILPAGNHEKASYAMAYGADAVYAGLPGLSLRSKYITFDEISLGKAIEETHGFGKRFYVACNLFAHETDLNRLERFLNVLKEYGPDALIVSDPGVIRIIRKRHLEIPLHLSTQANVTNSQAIEFWREEGIERVILARELSFRELERICVSARGIELEIFIHGAMCVSYSGRCLLSNFLTGRDANRGECAGTCRWRYSLVEETREGEYYEIEEDARGTYILNSRDLCLVQKIPELAKLPIHGYKVEGRTKNLLYVSLIARAYRRAIDDVFNNAKSFVDPDACRLIGLTDSHGFTGGFLFPDSVSMQSFERGARRSQQVLGFIREYADRELTVSVKNPLSVGDEVLAISPEALVSLRIKALRMKGETIDQAYGALGHEVTALVDKNLQGASWQFGIIVKG
jgi:putative protease